MGERVINCNSSLSVSLNTISFSEEIVKICGRCISHNGILIWQYLFHLVPGKTFFFCMG